MRRTALVLGATGGIGGEIAAALLRHGWRVRAMARDAAAAPRRAAWVGPVQWVAGDALRPEDVAAAAHGTQVIVHAVNPPKYHNWAGLVLPMLQSTLEAAAAQRARVVLPGTVYNYGPDSFPVLREDSPQNPLTRKGAIRVEMERRIAAATNRGASGLVVRAGDFFGPHNLGNSWFGALAQPGRPVGVIRNPATPGVGHAWGYAPDVAETVARLLDRENAASFETFHMQGHWDPDGSRLPEAVCRIAGGAARVKRLPWPLLTLASPFVDFLRETREMRYLWREALRLDNTRLVAALGAEPHTPLDEAVRATLAGLGCLAEAKPRAIRNAVQARASA